MKAHLTCENKVTCLDAKSTPLGKINIVIGTEAGEIFLWSCIKLPDYDFSKKNVATVTKTKQFSSITGLIFNADGTKMAVCDRSGQLAMFFIHNVEDVQSDSIVELLDRNLGTPLTCLNWSFNKNKLVVGDEDGNFYVWNMCVGSIEFQRRLHNGPILKVKYLPNEDQFLTAGVDNNKHSVKVWTCK